MIDRFAFFVACLFAIAGCNAIFGLDEPTLGETTAGAGATGQGGGGGASAAGGAGGGGAGAEAGAGGGPVPCTPDCTQGCFEDVCGGHHVLQVAPGEQVNCALLQSRSVWCWGNDRFGAVGNGEGSPDSCLTKAGGMMVPCALQAQRLDLPGPAVAVSTGWHAACAVLQTGDLYCWGINTEGQLGHAPGTEDDVECEPGAYCQPSPHLVTIPGMPDVAGVQLGTSFGCAGGVDGSVTCWGMNAVGQAGTDEASAELVAPGTLVGGVSANGMGVSLYGDTHVCIARSGSLHLACWGGNNQGALGVAPNKECGPGQYCETHPVEPDQGPITLTTNTFMAPARRVTCVVTSDTMGNVWCAGFDGLGMRGTAPSPWPPTPDPTFTAVPFFADKTVTQVTGNHMHYCALTNGGDVYCWGVNQFGELGIGSVSDGEAGACGDFNTPFFCYSTPQLVEGLRGVEGIRASGYVSMAIKDGQVYAWGVNQSGQLGHDPGTAGDVLCPGSPPGDSLFCNPTATLVGNLPGPDPR